MQNIALLLTLIERELMIKLTKKIISTLLAVLLIAGSATVAVNASVKTEDTENTSVSATAGKTITINAYDNMNIRNVLQAALDEARDNATDASPYKIVIPAGTYYLSGAVFIYSNTTISAYGAHIIKQSTSGCMVQAGHMIDGTSDGYFGYDGFKNITLLGGNWDGNCYDSVYGKAKAFSNIRIGHATNVKLQDVSVTNNVASHHLEIGGVDGLEISDCTFSGYTGSALEAIQLDVMHSKDVFNSFPYYDDTTCKNVYIHDNKFDNLSRAIGSHNAVMGKYHDNIKIYNNKFSNIADKTIVCYNWANSKIIANTMNSVGAGIDFKYMDPTNYHNPTNLATNVAINPNSNSLINNNEIYLNKYSNVSTVYGIRVGGGVVNADNNKNGINEGNYYIENVDVAGNTIKGSAKYGLRLEYANNCKVRGNWVNSSEYTGVFTNIRSLSLFASSGNTISENYFEDLRGVDSNSIQVEGGSNFNTLNDNTIIGVGKSGISLNLADQNKIVGGIISDCGNQGVTISNGRGNSVSGVTIDECKGHIISLNNASNTYIDGNKIYYGSKRGINVATSKNVTIKSNNISDCNDIGISINSSSSAKEISKNILTYNGGSNAIDISSDSTAPVSNLANTVLDIHYTNALSVSGKANKSSTVKVYNGTAEIGSTKSGTDGKFTVSYASPNKVVFLTFSTTDKSNNQACDRLTYSNVEPENVSLNLSSMTLGVGDTYKLIPSSAGTNYSWSSSNTSVATISESGIVTAKKVGTATITIKTAYDKTASCKLTVKPAPTSVKLSDTNITLGNGDTYIISESTNSGSWATNFTWSSSNTKVATIEKTSGNKAKITAKGVGTTTISIKLYNGKSASCKLTVKSAPTSVKLSDTKITLGNGDTYIISESTNSGSWATNFTWSSSNTKVATIAKTSGNKAKITTKGVGTTTISIKLYNGKTASCKLTVKPAPTSAKLSKTSLTLNKGNTYIISESTNSGSWASNFTWSSSNTKVATIAKTSSNKAKITAVAKGTCTITFKTYNGKTATCKVTVK